MQKILAVRIPLMIRLPASNKQPIHASDSYEQAVSRPGPHPTWHLSQRAASLWCVTYTRKQSRAGVVG